MWLTHYFQRTFVFPARIRARGKRTPIVIVGSAFAFNVLNAMVCAPSASAFEARDAAWLGDPRFIAGVALFVAGFVGNVASDEQLRRLRRTGETGYTIPRGGLFELVSSPNYLCELVEWSGWALASWSLGGLAFALYTAANLVPRARSNHAWYRATFSDYPPDRKALVPFVW
jgi:3-oxo-5-alpha-steroid 4-dehydrogenase 1